MCYTNQAAKLARFQPLRHKTWSCNGRCHKKRASIIATAPRQKIYRTGLLLPLQLAMKPAEQHASRQRLPLPEAVQPAICGFVDFPVGFCGVPVIKGVGDFAWKLLVAADPNHNLPVGFHAPEQSTCHLRLHSIAALSWLVSWHYSYSAHGLHHTVVIIEHNLEM